jgi:hypothetical protein
VALVQNWYLSIVGKLNVPMKKIFILFKGDKENYSLIPADLAVRSFLLTHLFRLFFSSLLK